MHRTLPMEIQGLLHDHMCIFDCPLILLIYELCLIYRLYNSIIQNKKKIRIMAQQKIFATFAFTICILLNIGVSRAGYSNILTGDKDILLPFSCMIFLFFPLLIYLPEAHYKFTIYGDENPQTGVTTLQQQAEEEQQKFPYAFFVTLLSVTISILMHRTVLFNISQSEDEMEYRKQLQTQKKNSSSMVRHTFRNMEYRVETLILKYFLSLGIGLQNIVSAFYITIESEASRMLNEFIIFCIFSLIINFAYGYLNGWSTVSKDLHYKLTNFINIGILLGFFLGLILGEDNLIILILPCLCCGLMIYSSTLVCLPALFSQGEDQAQDKFRYGAIFTSLLLTVVYHPFCYLMRV